MKHIKLKIVFTVWLSVFLLLAVCEMILVFLVPRHYKSEAYTALQSELSYAGALNDYLLGDSEDFPEYAEESMSGDVLFFPYEPDAPANGFPENNSGGFQFNQPKPDKNREEHEIISYIEKNSVSENTICEYKTKAGKYIFAKYTEYMPGEGYQVYIMYINLNRILNYTKSINYILLFFFAAVSSVMSVPGYILAKKIELSQETQRKFFQNTSHELKTPLMTVQGYAEGIQTGVTEPKQAAEVILQESDRMAQIVNELLSLSKIDLHSLKPVMTRTDIREVLYDSIRTCEPLMKQRGINIVPILPESPVYINGDEDMLERVFTNILSNAVRHCKTEVKITCTPYSRFIMIKFHDDGDGIAENDLPHIFERFYTGENGSTGLGLSLACELVKLHGGTINAYNDNGAVFAVKFLKN